MHRRVIYRGKPLKRPRRFEDVMNDHRITVLAHRVEWIWGVPVLFYLVEEYSHPLARVNQTVDRRFYDLIPKMYPDTHFTFHCVKED